MVCHRGHVSWRIRYAYGTAFWSIKAQIGTRRQIQAELKPSACIKSWEKFIFHGAAFFRRFSVANHNSQKSDVSQTPPPSLHHQHKKNRIFTRRAALGGATFAEFCGAAFDGAVALISFFYFI